jgi:hypothetical protein
LTYRLGVAVVSTLPTTFDGSLQPLARVFAGGRWRETLDPDDFKCGFGTWSGTSFAAPILAGQLARSLQDGGELDKATPADAVRYAWAAIEARLRHLRRPGP